MPKARLAIVGNLKGNPVYVRRLALYDEATRRRVLIAQAKECERFTVEDFVRT